MSGADDGFLEELALCPDESPPSTSKDPLWFKGEPELDTLGNVTKGGMWEHQLQWWNLPNFYKVLVGGFGSGKTLALCKRAIAVALDNAPCPVALVSPTYKLARTTTIYTMKGLLEGKRQYLNGALVWTFNQVNSEFTIKYHGRRATITIYSGENPDALRGPNLAAAYIDEPFIQDEAVFNHMTARVRHPQATFREICLTGTPESIGGWGYDICVGEKKDKTNPGVVYASTRLNRALSPDYVERLLAALDERAAQAYIEGKFINLAGGLVYYAFDPTLHVQDLPIPDACELGAGMDFNVDPLAACVFWRAGSHIHYFAEYEFRNSDTEYACQTLREEWNESREGKPQLWNLYPDATGSARKTSAPGGKTDFYYIRQAGFTVNARDANPKQRDRYNAVNGKLKPAALTRSGNVIVAGGSPRDRVTLTISPKCKKLIKYLSVYAHAELNTPEQKAFSHLLDAFSYPISYLFPVTRESLTVRVGGA